MVEIREETDDRSNKQGPSGDNSNDNASSSNGSSSVPPTHVNFVVRFS